MPDSIDDPTAPPAVAAPATDTPTPQTPSAAVTAMIDAAQHPMAIIGATVILDELDKAGLPISGNRFTASVLWAAIGLMGSSLQLTADDVQQVCDAVLTIYRTHAPKAKAIQDILDASKTQPPTRRSVLSEQIDLMRSLKFAKTDGKLH